MAQKLRQPWNKGRYVGPRQSLTVENVAAVLKCLKQRTSTHDLCMFSVAIDSMLRASDLMQLRTRDVINANGEVVDFFHWRQKKTSGNVALVLTHCTKVAIRDWLKECGKESDQFLFTRQKAVNDDPITIGFYRRLVKEWIAEIGLSPDRYSAHSLRRTKPQFMYGQGVPIEIIALLLGHKNTTSTVRYLGIDHQSAYNAAIEFDIFQPHKEQKNEPSKRPPTTR